MAPGLTAALIRHAVRLKLKAKLEELSGTVPVSLGHPGKSIEREHIWLNSPTGDVEYVLIAAATTPTEDAFQFTVVTMAAKPGQTDEEAEARAEELGNLVVAALFGCELGGIDDGRTFVLTALMGRVDGPHSEMTNEGAAGFMSVDVAVRTRTTY
jgi:hypothetical protein